MPISQAQSTKRMLIVVGFGALCVFGLAGKDAEPVKYPEPVKPVVSFKPDHIIAKGTIGGAIGCAVLDEGALNTGKATGRIFALENPDRCRGLDAGTVVLSQKHFRNAVCVLPEGASPQCLWVLMNDLIAF